MSLDLLLQDFVSMSLKTKVEHMRTPYDIRVSTAHVVRISYVARHIYIGNYKVT